MPLTQSLLDWRQGLQMMQPQNSEGGDYIKSMWKPTRRLSCSPLFEFKGSHLRDERAVRCPPSPLIFIARGQTSGWSPWRQRARAGVRAGAVFNFRSRASPLCREGVTFALVHAWAQRWAGWSLLQTCFLTLPEATNRAVSHGGKTVGVKKGLPPSFPREVVLWNFRGSRWNKLPGIDVILLRNIQPLERLSQTVTN